MTVRTTTAPLRRVVVVGASLAGVTAADTLSAEGFDGTITVLGAEGHPPYTRPPLSKGVLAGTDTAESVHLAPLGSVAEVRAGARAVGLDIARRLVVLASGESVPYDGLVLATGARARTLAAPGVLGEHVLRTVDDCLALAALLRQRPEVVVIGGGFLGMEVASTCRKLGVAVTVVDRDPPLVRLLGPWLAELVTAAAVDAGVRIVHAPGGVQLHAPDGIVRGVRTDAGELLTADVVVSAVGDTAEVEWLTGSGLDLAGGVVVDRHGIAAPGIVAAGDVAVTRGPNGALRRTPHWASAVAQARTAATTLLHGAPAAAPEPTTPYFWTEQFGLAVKVCGRAPVAGVPEVLAGSVQDRSALLRWPDGAAATINHRMPVSRLARLAEPALVQGAR